MSESIPVHDTRKQTSRVSRSPRAAAPITIAILIFFSTHPTPCPAAVPKARPRPAPSAQELAARGEYLVKITGCNDCHTPMKMGPGGLEPDMSRKLSGHPESLKMPPPPATGGSWTWSVSGTNTAFAGPWGISYASNLTPEENTGMINTWSELMFIAAMRNGKHMAMSRPIMPPMPWASYAQMTDEDLKAVYAYLRSIPPVRNLVPNYEPPASMATH